MGKFADVSVVRETLQRIARESEALMKWQ